MNGGTAVVPLRGPLQNLVGGGPTHEVEGATVTELLEALEQAHSALGG